MLAGSEVKSMREGHANIRDAYARVEDGEVWLYGDARARRTRSPVPISIRCASASCSPTTRRSWRWRAARRRRGTRSCPMRVYFKDGRAKIELALGRGKRAYDKRQALAKRDADREAERAMKGIRE